MNKLLRKMLGAIGLEIIKKQDRFDGFTVASVLNRLFKKTYPVGGEISVVVQPIDHDVCLAQAAIYVADAINNKFDYVTLVEFLQDEAIVTGVLKQTKE